jgi:hypothetical protein
MPSWKKVLTSGSNASLSTLHVESKIHGKSVTLSGDFISTGSLLLSTNRYDDLPTSYGHALSTGERVNLIDTFRGDNNALLSGNLLVDGFTTPNAVYFLSDDEFEVIFDFKEIQNIRELRWYPSEVIVNFSSDIYRDPINVYDAFYSNDSLNGTYTRFSGTLSTSGTAGLFTFDNTISARYLKINFTRPSSGYLNETEFKLITPNLIPEQDFLFQSGSLSGSSNTTASFGYVQSSGDILPTLDVQSSLGSPTNRFANIYTGDIELSNDGTVGNEVDGTTGQWTIQEGEEDLFLLNRKSGKKYKFLLQKVDA